MSSPGTSSSILSTSPLDRAFSPSKRPNRPSSRPSSRSSVRSARAPSPLLERDDPAAIRNHISTLKHTIRHQQAQVHDLENVILRGPRPYSALDDSMASTASPPPAYSTNTNRVTKRSSFEVLQGIAGPESNLPLPRREISGLDDGAIKEGIPMSFGVGPASPAYKSRAPSPTRTLSRIPISSVGNARALADDGHQMVSRSGTAKSASMNLDVTDPSVSTPSASLSPQPPPSPNRRISLTPGGTTKVLADLQTGVINARNALENTKAQLRLSQRSVAQLTRQTEDLKEGRERLRLENEGLNNVVARKERLLQEVLERARKAETEATSLKAQLKTETSTSKKAMREMESALTESTALSQKSEREYITLRDSVKGMVDGWKADTDRLREEMRKRDVRWKSEAEGLSKKYLQLLEEVKQGQEARKTIADLKVQNSKTSGDVEKAWMNEIQAMKTEIERNSKDGDAALESAQKVAGELARLRRLIQHADQSSGEPS